MGGVDRRSMGGRAARPIRGGDTGPWGINLWRQGLLRGACRQWAAPCGLQLGSTYNKHKRGGSDRVIRCKLWQIFGCLSNISKHAFALLAGWQHDGQMMMPRAAQATWALMTQQKLSHNTE